MRKLEAGDVRTILRLVDEGSSEREVARQTGWSRSTVWSVKQRRAKGHAQLKALNDTIARAARSN